MNRLEHKPLCKLLRLVVLVAVSLSASTLLAQEEEWLPFRSLDNSFEVTFPGAPKYNTKEVLTNLGNVTTTNYSVVFDPDKINYLYNLNYIDYPEGLIHLDSTSLITELFHSSVEQLASSMNHEILYEGEAYEQGVPTYSFRLIDREKNLSVKGKCYIAGDRFYNLSVHTANPNSLNELMDKYLDSFLVR